jgi:hypothetical protein
LPLEVSAAAKAAWAEISKVADTAIRDAGVALTLIAPIAPIASRRRRACP